MTSLLLTGLYQIHVKFFSSINLLYIIIAIILMSRGYRALQDPLRKRQAHTVIWGVRLSVAIYALAILVPVLAPYQLPPLLRSALVILALLTGAGSIAWGIVRHQFLGLRSIVRQSIVYSTTTGLLLGTYLIIIRQLDLLVANSLGIRVPYLDIAFVVIAVIFFQPLLTKMEQFSERIFRRERSDYRNVIQRLTRDIISIFEIRELQEKIISTLRTASLTDRASLLLRDEKSGQYCAHLLDGATPGEIRFDRGGWTMRLMASANGPTTIREIDVFLEEEDRRKLTSLGAKLLIPISHGEELLGALCLGEKMGGRRYNFEDVAMLSMLAGQLAIALVNARLYQETLEKRRIEEELATAREIQVSLLPKTCPFGEGFSVSAMNKPSRWVGGDYHDFVLHREDKLGMAIGDVSGKGMPAALLMAVLQATFNAQVQNDLPVRETVSRINAHITRTTDIEKFVTFFYGELDLKSGQFTYSNAGHNAPLLIRADGQVQELTTGGLILGFMDNAPYEEETVSLAPGDTLFLYTDGIIEAQNHADEEFGTDRLVRLLLDNHHFTPDELLDTIFRQVDQFSGGDLVQQDDSTMVVLQLGATFRSRGKMT
jgi:sigma-B regulation protein RsbU (phosphoserine phosphatase)